MKARGVWSHFPALGRTSGRYQLNEPGQGALPPRPLASPPGYFWPEERGALRQIPLGGQFGLAAQVGVKNLRQGNRAIGLLAVLQNRNEATPHRKARPVERMQELRLAAAFGLEPGVHPPRLKIPTDRDRGNLAVGVLPGQPD